MGGMAGGLLFGFGLSMMNDKGWENKTLGGILMVAALGIWKYL